MTSNIYKEYWGEPDKQKQSWIVPVDDEGILTFPDELMDALDWHPGDMLEWIDNQDGSFTLKKIN